MSNYQAAKSLVRSYTNAFDKAANDELIEVAAQFLSPAFHWRGMHPFYEIEGPKRVVETFWHPLRTSFKHIQRREDVFFAGANDADEERSQWTCSMGHFMGLFDQDWLGIPKTNRLAHLRFAEFMRVEGDRIVESALFFDLIGLMQQAGVYPLPPMTGTYFMYPGPRTHDGLLHSASAPVETSTTINLLNRMIADLTSINHLDDFVCPPELLAKTWHDDMMWYGPCGIGASYTIESYQAQHQHPFRLNLADKTYNGHVARFAEGHYAGFFGWANLENRNTGGFLGLPEARTSAEMRVVDVYRRSGDKFTENWVIIDLPYYLKQQGLDVLERLRELRGL